MCSTGSMPFGFGLVRFFGLDLARGVGDVDGAVEQGRDAGAAEPPPVTEMRTSGCCGLVFFGPGQRQVDDGVGAFVFDICGSRILARFGRSSNFRRR